MPKKPKRASEEASAPVPGAVAESIDEEVLRHGLESAKFHRMNAMFVEGMPLDTREQWQAIQQLALPMLLRVTHAQAARAPGREQAELDRAKWFAVRMLVYALRVEAEPAAAVRREYLDALNKMVEALVGAKGTYAKAARIAVVRAVHVIARLNLKLVLEEVGSGHGCAPGAVEELRVRIIIESVLAVAGIWDPLAAAQVCRHPELLVAAVDAWRGSKQTFWGAVADLLEAAKLNEEPVGERAEGGRADAARRGFDRRLASGITVGAIYKEWNRASRDAEREKKVRSELERATGGRRRLPEAERSRFEGTIEFEVRREAAALRPRCWLTVRDELRMMGYKVDEGVLEACWQRLATEDDLAEPDPLAVLKKSRM